jgi:predicted nucleotidyltransferase
MIVACLTDMALRIGRRYHRRMRSDPPPLLPILRSRTQAGVLTVLLLNPDLELTQTELARRVGASLTSVVDEVRRLEQAGLLFTRTLGRARLVRAGSGPLVEALAEVMLRAFGPLQIIAEEFGAAAAELDSTVAELALFGSWAARYRGEPGAEPADLDVLVVVTSAGLDRGPLYAAADRAQQRLGRPVSPTVITTDRWARRGTGQDQFVDEIASRPIVPVPLARRGRN